MSDEGPMILPEGTRLRYLRHPDDELFDRFDASMVERWKESELSGDEWRFTKQVRCYSHGILVVIVRGLTLREALGITAASWRTLLAKTEDWPQTLTEIESRCCQPGCEEPWTVLLHPVRAYTGTGGELVRPYSDGSRLHTSLEVRGFCARHVDRGDCALDDANPNYREVLLPEKKELG